MKWWTANFSESLGVCAAYSGHELKSGEDRLEDVLCVMGQLAMRWFNAYGMESAGHFSQKFAQLLSGHY
jgi:hypothetical protein